MYARRNPYARKRFPWLKAGALLLLCGTAWGAYHYYWSASPKPAVTQSANAARAPAPNRNQATPPPRTTAPREQPITQLAILIFKSEKRLEVWGMRPCEPPSSRPGEVVACFWTNWSQLRDYPILAASGSAGPKLIEGDRQVPEGIYRIAEMNPSSRFHRALKLDYPNAFDRKKALQDSRKSLGGGVCIHGKTNANGCVAIGDAAIEDLYALVEQIGPRNVKVIIAPNDLRDHVPVKNPTLRVVWLTELYTELQRELKPFAKPLP